MVTEHGPNALRLGTTLHYQAGCRSVAAQILASLGVIVQPSSLVRTAELKEVNVSTVIGIRRAASARDCGRTRAVTGGSLIDADLLGAQVPGHGVVAALAGQGRGRFLGVAAQVLPMM